MYVADHARMRLVPVEKRAAYAYTAAGAAAQNVYLFAAANGLATGALSERAAVTARSVELLSSFA